MRSWHSLVAAAVVGLAATANAQITVDAGADLQAVVPGPATLGGVVSGRAPIDFYVADAVDGVQWLGEDSVLRWHEQNGFSLIGPITDSTGTFTYGFPSDLIRKNGLVYGIDTFWEQIYILNEATGVATVQGPGAGLPSWDTRLTGLASPSGSDFIYAIDFKGAHNRLHKFDLTSGTWSIELVGLPFASSLALAWDETTSLLLLYDADIGEIHSLDPVTKATSLVVAPDHDMGPDLAGLTLQNVYYDELTFHDGELYGTLRADHFDGSVTTDYVQVRRIDRGTGATRHFGPTIAETQGHSLLINSMPEYTQWTVDSGPGLVSFDDEEDPGTDAYFSAPGSYLLRLTTYAATTLSDTVSVTVVDVCSDGIDNDLDGRTDFPDDPGCSDADDSTETDPALVCDDGIDNDGDGAIDLLEDKGCRTREYETENPRCSDGIDNDGDGTMDYDGGEWVLGAGNPGLLPPDPQCGGKSYRRYEAPTCGLGGEAALALLPCIGLCRRWRRRRARSA